MSPEKKRMVYEPNIGDLIYFSLLLGRIQHHEELLQPPKSRGKTYESLIFFNYSSKNGSMDSYTRILPTISDEKLVTSHKWVLYIVTK